MSNRRTLLSTDLTQSFRAKSLTCAMKLTKYISYMNVGAIGIFALPAFAADLEDTGRLPVTYLPEITVTATRTPTLVSDTIAQTQVIDSEELKRYQGQTLLEVLKQQSGINFKQDGSIGQSANFYMRGYDSKRILVLVDGIRYGSVSTGQPAIQLLPADQIDRIEILYGASGSSIYGSNAMGGVIQIFTKGATAEASNASATIGYGSHDHYLYGVTGQWVNDNATVSLSASHNETDGISAQAFQTGENSDEDGFDSDNAAVFISSNINDNVKIGATGLYAKSQTEYDNYTNEKDTYIDQENGAYSVFGQYTQDSNTLKLTAGQSVDKLDNNIGDRFETTQTQATLTGTYALPMGTLLAGAEWLKQKLDIENRTKSNSSYSQASQNDRDIKSGFLGYQLGVANYDIQANVRLDDNSQFDTETIYGIGASFDVNQNIRIGANYATAYRAPTINDLYVTSSFYTPNPNLKVETTKNTEAFVEFNTLNQQTRITGFKSDADDLIDNVYDPSTFKYNIVNIAKARLQGVSVDSDWFFDNYLMGFQYSYLDSENRSGANKGKQLVYRPEHSGLLYAGYKANNFDLRGELEYVGERFNSHDNSTKLDDYQLLNLSGNYYLTPQWTLTSCVNNLLNKDYSTNAASGRYGFKYNHDGINFMTALTYKWQ